MEHMKFATLITAVLADATEKSSIDGVNDLLRKYNEVANPAIKKDRKDFAKDAQSILDDAMNAFPSIVKRFKHG